VSKSQDTGQRVYPTHMAEALFFWQMRQESLLDTIKDLCLQYYKQYNEMPDLICINHRLLKQFDKEIMSTTAKQLCVDIRDIIWFYCTPKSENILAHAQFVMVSHTQIPGKVCSI
jgi:hypothetical protein